jgi:hypothetical protein
MLTPASSYEDVCATGKAGGQGGALKGMLSQR